MFIKRYLHDILIAVEAIIANRLKSILTALGIIFGVAAVISMMAIGNGAEQEILEQIKLVGVNNIVITPSSYSLSDGNGGESNGSGQPTAKNFSKGLTLLDVEAIKKIVPTVERITPVISFNYSALLNGISKPVVLEGIENHYFDLFNMQLAEGKRFNSAQIEKGLPVCVVGNNIKEQFFRQQDPIGKYIKCGQIWLKIIGVVERRDYTASASDELGISSSDNKIFIPVQTMLLRFKNRSLIRADEVLSANKGGGGDGMVVIYGGQEQTEEPVDTDNNLNQLDKIIVQIKETEQLNNSATLIKRMMLRRHSELYDFEVTIPELLLKQQQKTKKIFNIVLGVIAGISLVVGGIGIMNIMLASVLERIREIGVRQALGAKQKDIIAQFLSESTLISLTGGIIGIILGVVLSKIITAVFDIKTIVSAFSIVIAFGVSVGVGIIFGYLPAKRAASNDPVVSLRS
ncbi:ABC transporter permease [Draconibacterium halophilum]|uniref:FtsX-like permease family protein n=1 Tax=Draconibacterium halophilum TaxID=2706887 RepID=A0A6C0R9Y8_9BACT|nr:ABC transporter permease [Draconibacterium halophilum]QIA07200.1 FtsX-like permease family protein [Draconibacterium halophilum]